MLAAVWPQGDHGLREHATHDTAVNVQLPRERAYPPASAWYSRRIFASISREIIGARPQQTYPLQAQGDTRVHSGNNEPQKAHRHRGCGSILADVDIEGASSGSGVDLVDSNALSQSTVL